MSDGTCLTRFKRAFIAQAEANGVANTSYQSPMQPEDILGDDGSGVAAWFGDHATATLTISVVAAPEIWIDEVWNIPLVVQALGQDTDADQETVDQLACERLGDIIGCFSDASFGLVDDTIQMFTAVPVGANDWNGGVLGSNLRACGFELSIELHARLVIGS